MNRFFKMLLSLVIAILSVLIVGSFNEPMGMTLIICSGLSAGYFMYQYLQKG